MVDPSESLVGPRAPLRKLAIATSLILAGAAAWWTFGRGKGEPEDPARVLIIGPTPELADYLTRKGFDAQHLGFGQAIGEGKAHDASLDDVAAIVEYADYQGIGHVALDLVHGQTYDFAGAGYEVEPPPGTTFVVLSVGKLGKHVSYGGVVPGLEVEPPADEKAGLLLALFAQPMLTKARTNDATNDLMIRFGAGRTLEDVLAYEKAQTNTQRQITAWQHLPRREQAEPAPIELAQPYERLRGWPLRTGALLLGRGRGAWHSEDGLTSAWSDDRLQTDFSWVELAALDRRNPCPSLPDTLELEGGFVVAPAGDALLVPSDRWVAELWVLGDEGCGFEQRSPIRRLANGELGQPRAIGRTAEALDGALMWADAKMEAYRMLRVPGVTIHDRGLVWLSDDVVALPVTLDFGEAAQARAARMAAAQAEAQPGEGGGEPSPEPAFDPATLPANRDALLLVRLPAAKQKDAVEVALVGLGPDQAAIAITPPSGAGGVILEHADAEGSHLSRTTLALEGQRWSDALAPEFDLAAALGESEFERVATLPAGIHDLAISPTGTRAAWTAEFDQPEGEDPLRAHEIVVLTFGGEPERRTHNDFADTHPRFVGRNGELLVFDSARMATEELPMVTTLRALRLD